MTIRGLRVVAPVLVAVITVVAACSGGGLEATRPPAVQETTWGGDGAPSTPATPGAPPTSGVGRVRVPDRRSVPQPRAGLPGTAVFGPGDDRIGITSATINLCVHGPFQFLPLVGLTSPQDLDVYWQWLRANGGVHGRNVETSYVDDQNTHQGAEQALERCRDHSSFAVVSGSVDTEILDTARAWSERTRTLYYFNFASERPRRSYSYSPFTSIETLGERAAEWILSAHGGKRIGLVYRQSASFEPGAEAFVATLIARGSRTTVQVGTVKDQTNYRDQVGALKGRAEVVFVLDDPIASTQLIKQARAQGYAPQWLLMTAFNLTTDTLGSDAVSPHAVEALTALPPYKPRAYGGPYARYGREVRDFEEAFRRYRGRPASSDIAWLFWSFWRVMAEQFERCGRDCTRNRFLAVREWNPQPFCPIRFTPGGNFGGTTLSIARAYAAGPGLAAWAEVPGMVCRTRF